MWSRWWHCALAACTDALVSHWRWPCRPVMTWVRSREGRGQLFDPSAHLHRTWSHIHHERLALICQVRLDPLTDYSVWKEAELERQVLPHAAVCVQGLCSVLLSSSSFLLLRWKPSLLQSKKYPFIFKWRPIFLLLKIWMSPTSRKSIITLKCFMDSTMKLYRKMMLCSISFYLFFRGVNLITFNFWQWNFEKLNIGHIKIFIILSGDVRGWFRSRRRGDTTPLDPLCISHTGRSSLLPPCRRCTSSPSRLFHFVLSLCLSRMFVTLYFNALK